MDKVGELEDMVRKNSEYQKLLQNKIKEMQNTEKQKEEEAVCREQKLIGKVRELEEQVKNQVSFSCEADPGAGSHVCFLVRRSSTIEVNFRWSSRQKKAKSKSLITRLKY